MSDQEKPLREQVEVERIADGGAADPAQKQGGGLRKQIEKTRVRQKSYSMDLRIHSPASLGYLSVGGIDTAPALVRLARVKGLDVIAVTDFHTGSYIDRVREAAKETQIRVIPGVVVRCVLPPCDDVTINCLFDESYSTSEVESFLDELQIPRGAHGDRRFLVRKPFDEILALVERRGGVVLPTRMDKTPHRMAVLPLLVEKYGFRTFDLAFADSTRIFKARWPKLKFNLFCFSNAHALAQVGSRTAKVKMNDPGFAGIRSLITREGEIAPRAQ